MTECEYCGKPLKAIGTARKNGKKTHNDWDTRKLHKKCFVEEQKYTKTTFPFTFMLNFRD